ncbi:hypothetical protein FACS189450_05360 [Spirochaetia bacterium]|nr:hypothetical protein FACS189450_05360 [Spirochaetia bacterium]
MKKSFVLIAAVLTAAALVFTACPPADGSNQDTTAPAEVTGLSAVPANGQVTLTWIAPVDSDFNKVEITFTPAADGVTQPISVSKGTNTKVITGLVKGTEYTFRVKTEDDSGNKSAGVTIAVGSWQQWVADGASVTLNHSVAADGTVTATVGGTAEAEPWRANVAYKYTAVAGKKYKYTFEAWTDSGTRTVSLWYYNNQPDYLTLTNQKLTTIHQTFTLVGKAIPVDGERFFEFFCSNVTGTFYVKMISITETTEEPTEVWGKYVNTDTAVTLDYSVDADGRTIEVIVGGAAAADTWRANVNYRYAAVAGKKYKYTFEAWTASGTRTVELGYYSNPSSPPTYLGLTAQKLTAMHKTFTLVGQEIPVGGEWYFEFQCADAIGTFYVKMISITETTDEPSGVWGKYINTGGASVTVDYSVDADGIAEVIVGGTAEADPWRAGVVYKYTAVAGKKYKYIFEAWTASGTRTVKPQYYGNQSVYLGLSAQKLTTTHQIFTLVGQEIPVGGERNFDFQCANATGTFYVKMISITETTDEPTEVWDKWVDMGASVTVDYSVDADGIAEVIVGGTAEADLWRVQVAYKYTAVAGKKYKYTFEAWTASGTRTVPLQYYNSLGLPAQKLTTTHQIFTLVGKEIPVGGEQGLDFKCAGATGTFYVKVISITETTDEPTGVWEKWAWDASVTLDYSVDADGIVEVIVGGTAEADPWPAGVKYKYTAVANKKYKYTFEAWTASGTRTVRPQYYANEPDYLLLPDQTLTTTRQTFTLVGQEIPVGGERDLEFPCADATGTFSLKLISITETTEDPSPFTP